MPRRALICVSGRRSRFRSLKTNTQTFNRPKSACPSGIACESEQRMTVACERLKELENPSLTADERATLRCEAASELIQAGQYDAAREALGELWLGIGARPEVSSLGRSAAAEVLLKAGVLSG